MTEPDNNIDSENVNEPLDEVQNAEGISDIGLSSNPADLTISELIAFPEKGTRPDWIVTRYPVSYDEYDSMLEAANQPDPPDAAAMGDDEVVVVADSSEDEDEPQMMALGANELDFDPPEDLEPVLETEPEGAPARKASFSGIPQTGFIPPDNTCAVGPSDVLLAVNTDLAVYSKSGQLRFRWPNMTPLFGNVLPNRANLFDPKVAYDHYSKRWIVVAVARRANPRGSWLMIAVSQGANPSGAWWVWALDSSVNGSNTTNNWADFPMLGFDTQAIYVTFNMFQFNGGFQYTKLRILNKAELYAGQSLRWHDFWNLKNSNGSKAFTVQPCTHFRGTGGNPPAYLVNSKFGDGDSLTLWTLKNPLGIWNGGSASISKDNVPCRSYALGPDARQKGTNTRIDSGDNRLLNAIFQNVGGKRRIWTSHTVKHTWPGENNARSVIGTYEIDVPTKKVANQKRYGAKGKYYYYPAIQTDISRNAYVVFARSSSSLFVELRYTGSKATNANRNWEGSRRIKAGESTYSRMDSRGRNRWGDYFGICRDGGNNTAVWMYGEYAESGNSWGTWVASSSYT
jgi:hypothetical protein